jgi:hypothetical protein
MGTPITTPLSKDEFITWQGRFSTQSWDGSSHDACEKISKALKRKFLECMDGAIFLGMAGTNYRDIQIDDRTVSNKINEHFFAAILDRFIIQGDEVFQLPYKDCSKFDMNWHEGVVPIRIVVENVGLVTITAITYNADYIERLRKSLGRQSTQIFEDYWAKWYRTMGDFLKRVVAG